MKLMKALLKFFRLSRMIITTSLPIDERTYLIPWNPIIHFRKSFKRAYLAGGWELRLRLYTRGDVSVSYKQDYAVTIEILDHEKKLDVYSDILHEYGSIYKRIKLRIAA
jgi:hypothetical protein